MRQVLLSIAETAFVASPYPVVLSLEMHCSLPQQETLAAMMVAIFGSRLARPEECVSGGAAAGEAEAEAAGETGAETGADAGGEAGGEAGSDGAAGEP